MIIRACLCAVLVVGLAVMVAGCAPELEVNPGDSVDRGSVPAIPTNTLSEAEADPSTAASSQTGGAFESPVGPTDVPSTPTNPASTPTNDVFESPVEPTDVPLTPASSPTAPANDPATRTVPAGTPTHPPVDPATPTSPASTPTEPPKVPATPTGPANPTSTPIDDTFDSPLDPDPFESPLDPIGDAFESPIGLPNPASVYCEEQGNTLDIRTTAEGDTGFCVFPDGTECEEWAFFRGECAAGTPAP